MEKVLTVGERELNMALNKLAKLPYEQVADIIQAVQISVAKFNPQDDMDPEPEKEKDEDKTDK